MDVNIEPKLLYLPNATGRNTPCSPIEIINKLQEQRYLTGPQSKWVKRNRRVVIAAGHMLARGKSMKEIELTLLSKTERELEKAALSSKEKAEDVRKLQSRGSGPDPWRNVPTALELHYQNPKVRIAKWLGIAPSMKTTSARETE